MKTSAVKHFTKLVAATMSAVFAFTLIPMALGQNAVEAATAITKDQSNTNLGVSGIENPTSGGDTTSPWSGCYVYFGTYGRNPIKFRVLTKDSPHTSSAALLLDSDAILETMAFGSTNDWSTSSVKTWLKDDFFTSTNFTKIEMAAVPATKNEDPHVLTTATVSNWSVGAYGSYVPLSGEQVFLLDAEEASNSSYGYSYTDESCVSRQKTGGNGYWWLRSATTGLDYGAGYVYDDGSLGNYGVSLDDVGVAPALNINQKSIIFNTKVEGETNSYKLTLSDSNLKIAVPAGQYVTATGTTITVPYAISGDDAGTATRASILITKGEWDADGAEIILYNELGASTASSGTFTLPSECNLSGWGTDYHVYMLAETINDIKETDYASEPVEIKLTQIYKVTVQNDGNGTATADVTSGPEGTEVTLTATPGSGYQFKEWQVVSGGITVTDNKFTIGTTDVTVKAVFEAKPADPVTVEEPAVEPVKSTGPFTYTVVSGGDSTWTEGDPDLVVKVKSDEDGDHSFERYEYSAIDGTKLTNEQAPATSGSTVITIKSDYLKTLSEGKHTILVNFTDASITTTITIVKKSSGAASVPATGEMIGVTAVAGTVMILSACSILIVMRTKKREDEL